MSRRDTITMGNADALTFLEEERMLTCASHGPRGWPHLMPLWYVLRAGTLWSWTYAASQKVKNLERDPRCTLQVEAGRDEYQLLRGIMLESEARIHRDRETVAGVGIELSQRYGGSAAADPDMRAAFEKQAAKRVALEFVERHRASWDHRKLGGIY